MAELVYLDAGRAPYGPTLELQERLLAQVQAAHDEQARLVLVEHDPPVITLGRGAKADNVVAPRAYLDRLGVEVHQASRGGDVTYHGPGQLVAYPIIRLDLHGRDVHRYMRDLEEVIIRVLARFGIQGVRVAGMTGVWVGRDKVAAIGVAVRRWVTWHGVALNVCPNLDHFGLIVPCGIRGRGVTSIERIVGRPVSVAEVKPLVVECVVEVFGFTGARAAETAQGRLPK